MPESPHGSGGASDSRPYRVAAALMRLLIRVFFRRVEVDGLENVPVDRGGLLVAWHPNGLVDPALIMTRLPDRVVFGARHGLLRIPVLGAIMRALGTVPIYRASDHPAAEERSRRAANRASLDALAEKIVEGKLSALFPEGESHDAPHLMELKSGAARLYYAARRIQASGDWPLDLPGPAILPVGLHYDRKHAFRSRALVQFHPPLAIPPGLDVSPEPDEPIEAFLDRARRLTGVIERGLEAAVLPTETWEIHGLMHRARKLVRAERAARAGTDPGRPRLLERQVGFSRVWTGYRALLASDAVAVERLVDRVREYEADLRALDIEDHELDRDPRLGSAMLPLILAGQVVMVYVLLPPILVVGLLVNLPPAWLTSVLARRFAKAAKDEASLKVLIGVVLFPLTWIGVAAAITLGLVRLQGWFPALPSAPLVAGVSVAALGAAGGIVALRYRRLSAETARAVRVRRTRRRRASEVDRLRTERSDLCDRILALAEGLDLPGRVAPDGTVSTQ